MLCTVHVSKKLLMWFTRTTGSVSEVGCTWVCLRGGGGASWPGSRHVRYYSSELSLRYPVAKLRKLLFAGFCGIRSNLGVGAKNLVAE